MEWIFIAFLIVSMIHMGEEYFYPGGFTDVMKRLSPKFAPLVTAPTAVIINGLQLLLCLVAIAIGKNVLAFMGCVRVKGYAPGVIIGVLLYMPLSAYAYYLSISSGQLTLNGVIVTAVLGLLYQAVPISYFVLASAIRRA
jgi:hypothetical protein